MRAITLHQPIASAVPLGLKTIETRSWSTKYRGPIVIHAALDSGPDRRATWEAMHAEDRAVFAAARYHFFTALPFMRPVAVAELVNVLSVETLLAIDPISQRPLTERERRWGDYAPGRFAWILRDVRPVHDWPRHVTGYQGLWHWRHGSLDAHLGAALRPDSTPLR